MGHSMQDSSKKQTLKKKGGANATEKQAVSMRSRLVVLEAALSVPGGYTAHACLLAAGSRYFGQPKCLFLVGASS